MCIAQKRATLGSLKLTLNELIHPHGTFAELPEAPPLHHGTGASRADQSARRQGSAMARLLSEDSAAQVADAIEQTFTAAC